MMSNIREPAASRVAAAARIRVFHERQKAPDWSIREPDGRGGSAWIHDELRVGDRLLVTRPKNNFALEEAPYHALIAGGVALARASTRRHSRATA